MATITVDTLFDRVDSNDGVTSLREAILAANLSPGLDTIAFDTARDFGPGRHLIRLTEPLPVIGGEVRIDGATQPGYADSPLIEIHASGQVTPLLELVGAAANGSSITGIKLSGYAGIGISIDNVDDVRIEAVDLSDAPGNYSQTAIRATSGSDRLVVRSVDASGVATGLVIQNSASPTLEDNSLRDITGDAISLSNVTGLGVAAIRGTQFDRSGVGLRLAGINGLVIGSATRANAQIQLEDELSGLSTVTSTALALTNCDDAWIDDVQLGAIDGAARGVGLKIDGDSDRTTIISVDVSNRAVGIDISGGGDDVSIASSRFASTGTALRVDGARRNALPAPLVAVHNDFSYAVNALDLRNMSSLTIAPEVANIELGIASGLPTVSGTVLALQNVDNVTVSHLNFTYAGLDRSGVGISSTSASDNLRLENLVISNRTTGITITGGVDPIVRRSVLTNNGLALALDGATDGTDAGTAPVTVAENQFAGSADGLVLENMSGVTVGVTGSEAVVLDNATSGLQQVSGNVILLHLVPGATVDGLDLSWQGGPQRSGKALFADQSIGLGVTIRNIVATHRESGIEFTGAGQDLSIAQVDVSDCDNGVFLSRFTDGGDSDSAPVLLRDVNFAHGGDAGNANSSGLTLFSMSGVTVGPDASNQIVVKDSDGLGTHLMNALRIRGLTNSTIRGLDLSYVGDSVRTGRGIYSDANVGTGLTLTDLTIGNRQAGILMTSGGTDLTLTNIALPNNDLALSLRRMADGADSNSVPVQATELLFTGSTNGIAFDSTSNQFFGAVGTGAEGILIDNQTAGLDTVSGTALRMQNMTNATIDGLDLSWSGATRSGIGLLNDTNAGLNRNIVVRRVNASGRDTGLSLRAGGQDLTLENNLVRNANQAIVVANFTDGADAGSEPVVARDNVVTDSANGWSLESLTGQSIGAGVAGISINNELDGLTSVSGVALRLRNTQNVTVSNLDLSWTGLGRQGIGLLNDSNTGSNKGIVVTGVQANHRDLGFGFTLGGQDLTVVNSAARDAALALYVDSFTDGADADTVPLVVRGNDFAGSDVMVKLFNMTGLTIGDSDVAAANIVLPDGSLGSAATRALHLRNIDNLVIDGLDVSWTGPTARTGQGIYSEAQSDNVTIRNVSGRNRAEGLRFEGGSTLRIESSALVANGVGIVANAASNSSSVVNSRIEGNTTGLQAQVGGSIVVAENNYWGVGGGPGVGGNNPVAGNVDSSPFLTSCMGACPAAPLPPATPPLVATPTAGFYVTTNADLVDGSTSSVAALVANPGLDGAISLREAILAANSTPGLDTIGFAIGSGPQTIRFSSVLPVVTDSLVVDGTSQPGYAGIPLISLDAAGLAGNIWEFRSAANSTLNGLQVLNFAGTAARLEQSPNVELASLILRTDTSRFNLSAGIDLDLGSNHATVEGVDVQDVARFALRVANSTNPTIRENRLQSFQPSGSLGTALLLDSVSDLAADAVRDNDFSASRHGIQLINVADVRIGPSGVGAQLVIDSPSSGLGVVDTPLVLQNSDRVTIANVALAWTGPDNRVGVGLAAVDCDELVVRQVDASHRATAVSVRGGTDLVVEGNDWSSSGVGLAADGIVDGPDADSAPLRGIGNYVGSIGLPGAGGAAFQLWNMTGLNVGSAGSDLAIDSVADGVASVVGTVLSLRNLDDSLVHDLDLSSSQTAGFTGRGIWGDNTSNDRLQLRDLLIHRREVAVQIDGGVDLAVTDSDLSDNGTALQVANVAAVSHSAPLQVSGVTVAGSGTGYYLKNLITTPLGMTIGGAGADIEFLPATAGLETTTDYALRLDNIDRLTIRDLDLSYSGEQRLGIGLRAESSMDNLTLSNVRATRRAQGVSLVGGADLRIDTLDASSNVLGLTLDGFTDGVDSDSYPVKVTGLTLENSGLVTDTASGALRLWNMSNLQVGPHSDAAVVLDESVGLRTSVANALAVRGISNSTIQDLDLSYAGTGGRIGRGLYSDASLGTNVLITRLAASNRTAGIQLVAGGQDLTLTDNLLLNNDQALDLRLFSDGADSNLVPIVAARNRFRGSTNGLFLEGLNNQFIGAVGTGIIIDNRIDGLGSVPERPLVLRNSSNAIVDGLDLTYAGTDRSGVGIYSDVTLGTGVIIRNVVASHREAGIQLLGGGRDLTLVDNRLTDNGLGLELRSFSDSSDSDSVPVVAARNDVTGSDSGMSLDTLPNQFIGVAGTGIVIDNARDGLPTTGIASGEFALQIRNLNGATIDGLDLSYAGDQSTGYGLVATATVGSGLIVRNLVVGRREGAIRLTGGGQDLSLINNRLFDSQQALRLDLFSDGADSDTAPIQGINNTFWDNRQGLEFRSFISSNFIIGNTNVPNAHFVVHDRAGLTSIPGTAIRLADVDHVTIDGLDVSYRDTTRSGRGLDVDTSSDNVTIRNVTSINRQIGIRYDPQTTATTPSYLVRVIDSTVLDNDIGLSITEYNPGGSVSNSRIERNGVGIDYATGTGVGASPPPVSLAASGNYWGSGGEAGQGGNNGVSLPDRVVTASPLATVPTALHRDLGDNPVAFEFSTELIQFAARHLPTGPTFGATRDAEPDTLANPLANTDDATGALDDEDGVTVSRLVPGELSTARFLIANAPSGARVDAWIDFNQDGDWLDAGEQIAQAATVSHGENSLSFLVPATALVSTNYARFRLSTAGGLAPHGSSVDGEVEDRNVGNLYVDDDWRGLPTGALIADADPVRPGAQPARFGLNAFGTVVDGLAAAWTDAQVIVNSGDYSSDLALVDRRLWLTFQEGPSSVGQLADTVADATLELAQVELTVGPSPNDSQWSSPIRGEGTLRKLGDRRWTLANDETLAGGARISDGTLALDYSTHNNLSRLSSIVLDASGVLDISQLADGTLSLVAGQTLAGHGRVTGNQLHGLANSTISPGLEGPGVLRTTSLDLTFNASLAMEVFGPLAGQDFDQLSVTGDVRLGNSTLRLTGTGSRSTIILIDNDGADPVHGEFYGLPEGATISFGSNLMALTYVGGDGNDVALIAPNQTPTLAVDAPTIAVDEGSTATNTGTWNDSITDIVTLTASIGEVVRHADGSWAWSFDTLDGPDDSRRVTITATDSDGATSSVEFDLTVRNVPPVIEADASTITVDEGQTATNNGTWSDPGVDVVTLTASIGEVVRDNDGSWTWSFDTLDGPDDSRRVTITATDSDGATNSVEFDLTVRNVAPVITSLSTTAAGCGAMFASELVELAAVFTDSGVAESHLAEIDWGDGIRNIGVIQQVGEVFEIRAEHRYAAAGRYEIELQLTDDGATPSIARTIASIAGARLLDGELLVQGTDGYDYAALRPASSASTELKLDLQRPSAADPCPTGSCAGGTLPVANSGLDPVTRRLQQVLTFPTSSIRTIVFQLCAADDAVTAQSVNLPMRFHGGAGADQLFGGYRGNEIFGDEGDDRLYGGTGVDLLDGGSGDDSLWGSGSNDTLRGGSGNDLLLGMDGNDLLEGNVGDDILSGQNGDDRLVGDAGRDLLFGGRGFDIIQAGDGEDLVIGSFTLYDNSPAILQRFRSEWTSDRDQATRIDHLRQGTGIYLQGTNARLDAWGADKTIKDDDARDAVLGDEGNDWCILGVADELGDLTIDEVIDQIA